MSIEYRPRPETPRIKEYKNTQMLLDVTCGRVVRNIYPGLLLWGGGGGGSTPLRPMAIDQKHLGHGPT